MARISQYKALGTKMGGYKTTLSKVQSMEYAKKHADWKAGEQKALYGEIGGTVANIIGIADEHRRLKDLESRRKSLLEPMAKPDRPAVGIESEEPGIIGDVGTIGEKGTGDEFAPEGMDTEAMQTRGPAFDTLGIKLPPKPADYSGAPTAGQRGAQSRKITIKPEGAGALPVGTGVHFAEKRATTQDRGLELQSMGDLPSLLDSPEDAMMEQWAKEDAVNPLFNEQRLDRLERQDELASLRDKRAQRKDVSRAKEQDAELDAAATRMGITREELVKRRGEDKPLGEQVDVRSGRTYYADETGQRSPSRLDDTPVEGYRFGSGGRKPYVPPAFGDAKSASLDVYDRTPLAKPERPNIPANVDFINDMTESAVMGKIDAPSPEMLGDEEVMDMISDPSLGDFKSANVFYGKLNPNQQKNLQIAKNVGGDYAQKVMMRESSAGVNTGDTTRAGSVFQYRKGGTYMGNKKIPEGVIGDVAKETQYFQEYNREQTKGFDTSDKNTFGGVQMTYEGKASSVYEIASKAAGMTKESVNYLTHQQGRGGLKDILNSAEKGQLKGGKTRFDKMIGNITPEFASQLKREFGSISYDSLKDSTKMKKFVKSWLQHQQSEWSKMEGDFY